MGLFNDLKKGWDKTVKATWEWDAPRIPGPFDLMRGDFTPETPRQTDFSDLAGDVGEEDLLTMITDQLLPQRMTAIRERGSVDPTDLQFFQAVGRIKSGKASQAEVNEFKQTAVSSAFFQKIMNGEFDDMDEVISASDSLFSDITDLSAFGLGAPEEEAASEMDSLTALYEEQITRQAEMEQINFERQGITDLVGLLPASIRPAFLSSLLQNNPRIGRLFFGDMGTGGDAVTGAGSAPSYKGSPLLDVLNSIGGNK